MKFLKETKFFYIKLEIWHFLKKFQILPKNENIAQRGIYWGTVFNFGTNNSNVGQSHLTWDVCSLQPYCLQAGISPNVNDALHAFRKNKFYTKKTNDNWRNSTQQKILCFFPYFWRPGNLYHRAPRVRVSLNLYSKICLYYQKVISALNWWCVDPSSWDSTFHDSL